MKELSNLFFIFGGILVFLGILIKILGEIGFFKLPGDIVIKGKGYTIYFPIVSMIILSIVLTVILNIISKFFR